MTVTVVAVATDAGALKVAPAEVIALKLPEPVAGLKVHVTPAFDWSFRTEAEI